MIPSDILTPRLRLVAMVPALLHADLHAEYSALGALLRAEVPSSWPPEDWEPHCFPFIRKQHSEHPHTLGWSRYVLLRAEPSTLIGTVGGFPRTDTEAEIGYGILPLWQRKGYATEAARALIGQILNHAPVQAITAQTFPGLESSLRVVKRCGMLFAGPGDEPGTVRYMLARSQLGEEHAGA